MANNQKKTISKFVESKAYISKEAWRVLVSRFKNKRFCIHLLIAAIEGLNPDDLQEHHLEDIYIDLNSIKERTGHTGNDTLSLMKKAIKFIFETLIEFENDELWSITPFFNKAMIHKRKALVKVSISPLFMPHLANLKQFLTIRSRILRANTRAIVFYGTLKSIHSSSIFKICVDELMDKCGVKYSNYGGFKNRFLNPVIKELAGYGIQITYSENKTGFKVSSLSFDISEETLPEEELSKAHLTEIETKKSDFKPIATPNRYPSKEKNKELLDRLKKPVEITPEEQAKIDKVKAEAKSRLKK